LTVQAAICPDVMPRLRGYSHRTHGNFHLFSLGSGWPHPASGGGYLWRCEPAIRFFAALYEVSRLCLMLSTRLE
jgi:hypothetical protein